MKKQKSELGKRLRDCEWYIHTQKNKEDESEKEKEKWSIFILGMVIGAFLVWFIIGLIYGWIEFK